jgi:hypothetical protein
MLGFTLELPWRENRRRISCIPPGLYTVRRREKWKRTAKYGFTYQVENVPGRDAILFHPANRPSEIEGCIATGLSIGFVDGVRGVIGSATAFERFRAALDGVSETFLHIQKIEGGTFHK